MGKITAIALICMVGVCGACGAQDGEEGGVDLGAAERADTTPQSFTVRLDSATTAENITAQIASAGREQIGALCAAAPGGSVRIYNPLVSGSYEDIACASVLSGDGARGEASAALARDESDGPIGQAQENLSPFTIACGLIVGGAGLVATYALCPRARTHRNERYCSHVTNGGLFALGIGCAFM